MEITRNAPKYPVAAGTYYVSNEPKDLIVNAYLGTCVGLALQDSEADVGGLIHFLLPEPTGNEAFGRPENYALTGLPLFLDILCNAGAQIDRLAATIAGGAFVGPLSDMDLSLDIGGRTVEIIEKILSDKNVTIQKSETGGFFSCRLSLDLKTWESCIEPLTTSTGPEESGFKKPDPKEIDKTIEKVASIPQVVLKIVRMIRNESCSLQDVGKEIRQDQVISAKVIKMCNSAFFQKKMDIDSIDRALVLLGEKQLLQLIISAVFKDFFSQRTQGYSLCKGGLFNHALGTAMVSESLANISGKVSADIAYTAGLLHDIGKVILDQYMGDVNPLFYRRTQIECENLLDVEKDTFGVTHDEIGGRLGERWSLPDDLIDAIKYHHHPESASAHSDLTHLVYLADLLTSNFLVGQEIERLNIEHLESSLQQLGFSANEFPFIIDNIPRQIFDFPFNRNESDTL